LDVIFAIHAATRLSFRRLDIIFAIHRRNAPLSLNVHSTAEVAGKTRYFR
jgi:hypothetical protein